MCVCAHVHVLENMEAIPDSWGQVFIDRNWLEELPTGQRRDNLSIKNQGLNRLKHIK